MKWILILIIISLLPTSLDTLQNKAPVGEQPTLTKEVKILINTYHELRDRRRHLPAGTWDKDLDDQLHDALSTLGKELGHPPYSKKFILKWMGKPDAIYNQPQMHGFLDIYEREFRIAGKRPPPVKGKREYLVYHWRGGHDFMFFISEEGIIVDHGWWFAYE